MRVKKQPGERCITVAAGLCLTGMWVGGGVYKHTTASALLQREIMKTK